MTASRLPAALELDVRAFIATLNVAGDRLGDLRRRYGTAMITTVMRRMIQDSDRLLRERLRELPDGVVHVADFLEHDGHDNRLYRVDLRLTKRGDGLVLDFSGSSPQAPGFINATRAGLWGGVTGALIPTLGFGIPWNEGLLRPVEVVAPDGLVCTAQHPAPVGSATVETVWVVTNVVCRALNLLLAASAKYRHRAQGTSSGTMATFNLGGVNQFGERFGLHLLDPLAGGSGAFASRDGIHAGGPPAVPVPGIADVERNEQVSPLLYLHRRLRPGSGGAGARRGGCSAEIAVTMHEVPSAEALIMTHGVEVPNTPGILGGLPGSMVVQRFGSGVLDGGYPADPSPLEPEELGGRWETLGPKPGRRTLTRTDVFSVTWQGGGGYGDPLLRDPEAVRADVVDGHAVTVEQAERVYGVVLTGGAVDQEATDRRRAAIRAERLGAPPSGRHDPAAAGLPLGPSLRLVEVDGAVEVRTTAGAVLCRGSTRWRQGAVARELGRGALGGRLHEDLTVTAYYCPRSGDLLSLDVHPTGEPPREELQLDVSGRASGPTPGCGR